ncbi:MAG: rhodanese-like domain-containing protein [Eubacterium sp.]
MQDYTEADGKTLITPEEMQAKWKKWNVKFNGNNELSFYCGTGWRASIPFLLCYQAGFKNISVYDGGWYQWQSIELDSIHHADSTKNEVQIGDPDSSSVVYTTVDQLPTDKAAGQKNK